MFSMVNTLWFKLSPPFLIPQNFIFSIMDYQMTVAHYNLIHRNKIPTPIYGRVTEMTHSSQCVYRLPYAGNTEQMLANTFKTFSVKNLAFHGFYYILTLKGCTLWDHSVQVEFFFPLSASQNVLKDGSVKAVASSQGMRKTMKHSIH